MRRAARWLTCMMAVVSIGVLTVAGVASAKSATMTVKPDSNLHNNQKVVITGSGFRARTTVYLVECLRTSTTDAGCDLSNVVSVTTTTKGALPKTKFTVVAGTIGNGTCGTTKGNANDCRIAAGNETEKGPVQFASVRISFKVKR
jgi:hypothetical protein